MTPAEWIRPRAEEWAEWTERRVHDSGGQPRQVAYGVEAMVGTSDAYGKGIDFAWFDERRCVEFNAAVNALPAHLGVIFRMQWLGSETVTVDTAPALKAMHCGVSRAGYYRRLEEATQRLYDDLR